jgi:hypothetical protein
MCQDKDLVELHRLEACFVKVHIYFLATLINMSMFCTEILRIV